jgi:hypothetical protein
MKEICKSLTAEEIYQIGKKPNSLKTKNSNPNLFSYNTLFS